MVLAQSSGTRSRARARAHTHTHTDILLAIIIGVVIDGFVGLKEAQEVSERDLHSTCFICHLSRYRLDRAGIGFDQHVRIVHNPRNYLLFLVFLDRKPKHWLTCQETFIKSKVFLSWFPCSFSAARRFACRDGALPCVE